MGDNVVNLRGKAMNAHAGAVLIRDNEPPVYVAGLAEWGEDVEGRNVEAVGVLSESRLTPEPTATGDTVSHGISGAVHLLLDATWRTL